MWRNAVCYKPLNVTAAVNIATGIWLVSLKTQWVANDLCIDNLESKLCADINFAVQEKDTTIDIPLNLIYQLTQERTLNILFRSQI